MVGWEAVQPHPAIPSKNPVVHIALVYIINGVYSKESSLYCIGHPYGPSGGDPPWPGGPKIKAVVRYKIWTNKLTPNLTLVHISVQRP